MPFVHEASLVGKEQGRGERLINMALQMVHALEVSGAGWYCDGDEGLFLRQYLQQASSLALALYVFFHAKFVDLLQASHWQLQEW